MEPNYPSAQPSHRFADIVVHAIGFAMIVIAGSVMITHATQALKPTIVIAVIVYMLSALVSNLASVFYHFSPLHAQRKLLRRIDHAAIYVSICGTFTPLLVWTGTTWTISILVLSWALGALGAWAKITNETVKSRWSTASYLGLGALGLSAMFDFPDVPSITKWLLGAGALCYAIGTIFYSQKRLPFRYSIWHLWVNLGALSMFLGIWLTLFQD